MLRDTLATAVYHSAISDTFRPFRVSLWNLRANFHPRLKIDGCLTEVTEKIGMNITHFLNFPSNEKKVAKLT